MRPSGFCARYGVSRLVWFETQLKRWRRAWRSALIESANPEWRDLYQDVTGLT
jgi:putative endonuclease